MSGDVSSVLLLLSPESVTHTLEGVIGHQVGGGHIFPGAGTDTVCQQSLLDELALVGEASLCGEDRVLEDLQGNRTSEREVELLVVDVIDYHGFGGGGREFGLEVKNVKRGVLLLEARVLFLKALEIS